MLCCPHRGEGRSHWSLPFQAVQVPAGSRFPLWQVYFYLLQWWEPAAAHREAQWTETLQMPALLLWDQTHRGAGRSPSRWAQGKTPLVLICANLVFANTELVYLHIRLASLTPGLFFPLPPQIWKLIPCCTSLSHFSLYLSFIFVCVFRNWKVIVSEAVQIDQNWQTAALGVWLSGKGSCVCRLYLKGVGERVVEQYQGNVIQPL